MDQIVELSLEIILVIGVVAFIGLGWLFTKEWRHFHGWWFWVGFSLVVLARFLRWYGNHLLHSSQMIPYLPEEISQMIPYLCFAMSIGLSVGCFFKSCQGCYEEFVRLQY